MGPQSYPIARYEPIHTPLTVEKIKSTKSIGASHLTLVADGGGIRGYSALLILQALMRAIGTLESNDPEDPAVSSFHPLNPAPCVIATDGESVSSKISASETTDTSPWLPCHYFDYAAGTSTGGHVSTRSVGSTRH